ncbi:SDR family oxidoreductase [Leifsonia sp. F6_8S_P_1B]|uniref:SDR family oxidoreductase n=1 Tax=Leifsonia williamsii TaxID=3035919 RepID=A0ABT8K9M6_9MICO|nr:SDR family oxidoreductase [Leifsonia williamsii]MDN4614150.1 SDR family oxidoreductase [Leifsonia williamsii]
MSTLDAFRLDGRHILVTGGRRGLGRAMAEAVAEAGAAVTITARSRDEAEAAAAELSSRGLRARGDALEVTDQQDVSRAFAAAESEFGPITGLINNAGVSIGATALETTPEVYRTVMGTNVDGVWNCSLEFARRLPEGADATILNVGSMSAEIVNRPRWQAPYLASKAAVHQLTKALAAEWADRGIRVNAVAPGYFLTEQSPVDQPEYYADCVAPAALKRYGLPAELGPAAVFLLSGASSFMTGSIVTIDGGYTLF